MAPLVSAAINLLGLVAITGAVLLTALVLRNPLAPNWLRSESVANAATLVLTAGVFVAISNAAAGLIGENINYGVAVILTGATLVVSSYVPWKVFNIGERLARTESGRSPFGRERSQLQPQAAVALEHSAELA
jgi:hypothetical protein